MPEKQVRTPQLSLREEKPRLGNVAITRRGRWIARG